MENVSRASVNARTIGWVQTVLNLFVRKVAAVTVPASAPPQNVNASACFNGEEHRAANLAAPLLSTTRHARATVNVNATVAILSISLKNLDAGVIQDGPVPIVVNVLAFGIV